MNHCLIKIYWVHIFIIINAQMACKPISLSETNQENQNHCDSTHMNEESCHVNTPSIKVTTVKVSDDDSFLLQSINPRPVATQRALADYTWEFYGGANVLGLALNFEGLNFNLADESAHGDVCLLIMNASEQDKNFNIKKYEESFSDLDSATQTERNHFTNDLCNPPANLLYPQGPIVQIIKAGHNFPDDIQQSMIVPGNVIRWRFVANAFTQVEDMFSLKEIVMIEDLKENEEYANNYLYSRLNSENLGHIVGKAYHEASTAKKNGKHYTFKIPKHSNIDIILDLPLDEMGNYPNVKLTTKVDGIESTSSQYFDSFNNVELTTVTVSVWSDDPSVDTTYNLMVNLVNLVNRTIAFDWDINDPNRGLPINSYASDFDSRICNWTWKNWCFSDFTKADLCQDLADEGLTPFCVTNNQYKWNSCTENEKNCFNPIRHIDAADAFTFISDFHPLKDYLLQEELCSRNNFCPYLHRYSAEQIIRGTKRMILEANRELMAATDGLFRLNEVKIVQGANEEWDIDILNHEGFRAFAGWDKLIFLDYIHLGINYIMNLYTAEGSRVLVHEMGHLLFFMLDEYGDGQEQCPHSIMYHPANSSYEFCTLFNHNANTGTDEMWEEIKDNVEKFNHYDYEDLVEEKIIDHRYGTLNPFKYYSILTQHMDGQPFPSNLNLKALAPIDAIVKFKAVDSSENYLTGPIHQNFINCVEQIDHATCGHNPQIYDSNTGTNFEWSQP